MHFGPSSVGLNDADAGWPPFCIVRRICFLHFRLSILFGYVDRGFVLCCAVDVLAAAGMATRDGQLLPRHNRPTAQVNAAATPAGGSHAPDCASHPRC